MKKKSASRSAFFNVRVLVGLFVVLAGVFLALIGLGTFSGLTASSAQAQQKHKIINIRGLPPGFDCATISKNRIDRQENLRAGLIMIACGESEGGAPLNYGAFSRLLYTTVTAPLAYGGVDVDLITGADNITHPTQSETYTNANPDNPNQIVVTYNDSRTASANYSGASYSSDGGTSFTRLDPSPFASGHGTNFGDPVTLYNKPTGTFFAIFLATGCGGQGIGAWTSTDGGVTWAVGACIHSGIDDRESGWADNNPSSPHYGNMYVSWNDFGAGGNLKVRFSTDNGATWNNERQLASASPFIRDTQITGDPATGDVYVAGMNEGPNGGLTGPRANKIYRSTDGGNTWTNTYTGPNFTPAGRANCTANSYFVCMYSPDTWRHMGWGEPAALNGVVSYVYTQHGAGADPADVIYIRSTDSGVTFSAPVKLNTDTTDRAQWQPNLSVTPDGSLFSMWYDERETTSCQVGNPAVPCYRMWARRSTDNGATWFPDMEFSDEISPLPGQPDGTVQPNYQGDYDYGTAIGNRHFTSWCDGRVIISGQSQQDAFFDTEPPGGGGTPSPTPTASPSATATATATPTATPAFCSWAAGPSMLSPGVRFGGVYFPSNGKFYLMGGRAFDGGGGEFTNPFEYDPVSNAWTQKSASYPDNKVNNMVCGVLNDAGTDYIYCVGGSESATSTATDRVFRYDPIADAITAVAAPWPRGSAGDTLPGGFAVLNNKLYTIGGFVINVQMIADVWEFDPGTNTWLQKISLPVERGYVPATAIDSLIYTAGGSLWDGTTLQDTNDSFVFDPVANTINSIASIPRATGETRALNFCNTMYVMGGGRTAPNPSNEVDIYDPVANSWSVGTPFVEPRRNFGTDTDGTNRIWLVGGYATDGVTPLDSMEIFSCPVSPCGTPSPTPTATATATPTATATATATPTATATFTPTPTATPRATPTPRFAPTPRPRPTPAPRP